jgi:hypothetical protein
MGVKLMILAAQAPYLREVQTGMFCERAVRVNVRKECACFGEEEKDKP